MLSGVDDKTNHLVHGYCRQYEISMSQNGSPVIVPPLIIYTCLMYYWMSEYFDEICEKYVERSDDKMKLKYIGERSDWYNSNFGKMHIDSTSQMVYKWELKVIADLMSNFNLILGVSSSMVTKEVFVWDDESTFYGYDARDGYRFSNSSTEIFDQQEYGEGIKGGDVFGICLDLSKKQLSFSINDDTQGIAFENVKCEKGLKYRLVVSFYTKDVSVELLSFESVSV